MSMFEAIGGLARRVSLWGEMPVAEASRPPREETEGGGVIYRLRHWPTLPSAMRTADVLRLLSLMSSRPVSRHWMLTYAKLPERRLDVLLDRLAAQGALEEINPASFPREPRASAR